MGKLIERYSDIIDLPHHQSSHRPHMTIHNRAAQFAPFAALTGYATLVRNTSDILLLDKLIDLADDWKTILDHNLQAILENPTSNQRVRITHFDEQATELGGAYVEYEGNIKKLKEFPSKIVFLDGTEINIENIIDMQIL